MALILYAASNPAAMSARVDALRRAGFDVAAAADADSLERAWRTASPAAVVLDLPISGLDEAGLRRLLDEADGPRVVVCGRPEVAAAVPPRHLFLAQPCTAEGLIEALGGLGAAPRSAPLAFDAETGMVVAAGRTVRLTPTEAQLLAVLVDADGAPVTVEAMIRRVWGYAMDAAAADLVRAHMYHLRQRLARAGLPALIDTLPRRGYRLVPPAADGDSPSRRDEEGLHARGESAAT